MRVDNLEFKDCGNGLWLPTRSEKTKYEEVDGQLHKRYVYVTSVSEIRLNEEVQEELFEIAFPGGTAVYDAIADVSYRTGRESVDDLLEMQVQDMAAMIEERNAHSRTGAGDGYTHQARSGVLPENVEGQRAGNVWQWAAFIGAISGILVVLSLFLARRTRRGRTESQDG